MTYLLAQDIGTSSAKAALFTSDGVLVRSCSTFYEVQRPAPNWAQQNAEVWWDAFLRKQSQAAGRIGYFLPCCHIRQRTNDGLLTHRYYGSPLCPSIIWEDGRALEQAKKIEKIYGEDAFYLITGMHISENYALPKIMWLKETQPDIYRRTACFLQSKDYIVYRMTGKMVTEATDAQYYHCFDILKNQWSADLLNAVEIDINKFPKLVKSGTIVGPRAAFHSKGVWSSLWPSSSRRVGRWPSRTRRHRCAFNWRCLYFFRYLQLDEFYHFFQRFGPSFWR